MVVLSTLSPDMSLLNWLGVWLLGSIVLATVSEAAPLSLGLDKAQLERRIPAYLAVLPSCKALMLGAPHSMKDEAGWVYSARGASSFDMSVETTGEQLTRITVKAAAPVSDAVLRDMRCITYALMRAVEPKYSVSHLALSTSKQLWRLAQSEPYCQLYFFTAFEVRLAPVQLVVQR